MLSSHYYALVIRNYDLLMVVELRESALFGENFVSKTFQENTLSRPLKSCQLLMLRVSIAITRSAAAFVDSLPLFLKKICVSRQCLFKVDLLHTRNVTFTLCFAYYQRRSIRFYAPISFSLVGS